MRFYKVIFDKMAGKKNRKEGLKVERVATPAPQGEKEKQRSRRCPVRGVKPGEPREQFISCVMERGERKRLEKHGWRCTRRKRGKETLPYVKDPDK